MMPPDNSTYCPTGKKQYEKRGEVGKEKAGMNKHDKKHTYSFYKCRECGFFHINTVTKRTLRVPKKLDKYPIKYTMPVKEEEKPIKVKKKKGKRKWNR